MDYISVIGIAFGLAMDAFAVAISNGATNIKINIYNALKIAFFFGMFQAFMPVAGWCVGKAGEDIISNIDHWIAFILLAYIGSKMIYESLSKKKNSSTIKVSLNNKTLILLAVATSIDALATGVILPSVSGVSEVSQLIVAVCIIGAITFTISFIGVCIGKKFGKLFSSKAEILGGIVLISIGTKILIEHLFYN